MITKRNCNYWDLNDYLLNDSNKCLLSRNSTISSICEELLKIPDVSDVGRIMACSEIYHAGLWQVSRKML